MNLDDFYAGISYLCELRPAVYRAEELRLWTLEQMAEELAAVAMQEDFQP